MSGRLLTDRRLCDPDGFYDQLISLYRERGDEESRLIDARLILLLANHIGDARVLDEALRIAAQPFRRGRHGAATAERLHSSHGETQ